MAHLWIIPCRFQFAALLVAGLLVPSPSVAELAKRALAAVTGG